MKRSYRMMIVITFIAFFCFCIAIVEVSRAQPYPSKPIELIVPAAPGSATDAGGRIIATYLSPKWGVSLNVVSKAGGQGITGQLYVAESRPDGYTLLVDAHWGYPMLGLVIKDTPKILWDRTFVAKVFQVPVFFIVRADAPWKTLSEVLDYARKNQKTFKFAAGVLTSIDNFSISQLLVTAGIDPGPGRVIFGEGHAPSLAALLGGHVDFGIGMIPDIKSLYPSKIRALAVTAKERIGIFPDIPTTREVGFPGASMVGWYGISGPPKLPENIVEKWEKDLEHASRDEKFKELGAKVGHLIRFVGRKEMQEEVKEEQKICQDIVEKSKQIK